MESRPSTAASDTPPSSLASPLASPTKEHELHAGLIRPTYHKHCHHHSKSSLNTIRSSLSARKEYMDSLEVPSPQERDRIDHIQTDRETSHKRRSKELQRTSLDGRPRDHHEQHHERPHIASRNQHASLAYRLAHGESVDDILRGKAATTIQRTYRGYRARRQLRGFGLDAGTRWSHAIKEAQYRAYTRPRPRAETELDYEDNDGDDNDISRRPDVGGDASHASSHLTPQQKRRASARQKWRRAAVIAQRAGLDQDPDSDSDPDSTSSSSSHSNIGSKDKAEFRKLRAGARDKRRKEARTMGLQYFLEMVDLKHRYGSNLRTYHEEWKRADTHENYFYWLDHGEGRNLDLAGCPRERLDREQVRYLSREERKHYLVRVDAEGRLVWAKNGQRIDTTERWKDSVHGIVPSDDPTPAFRPVEEGHGTKFLGDSSSGSDSDSSSNESEREAARAAKYATPGIDSAKGVHKFGHLSASTIFNKLLRKSVRKNTWIFVADTSFRLYVGIKNSGAFQHSSFLQGGRISAAGLVKIKNGRLTSLSPLSGHYRPPAANFRAFVRSLKDEGADMSRVSISKSYAVLVGLEAYLKTKRKGKSLVGKLRKGKVKIVDPEEAKRQEEEAKDKSESAEKERQALREEERVREENSTAVQVLSKLGLGPAREPRVEKERGEVDGQEKVEERKQKEAEKKEKVLEKLDDYPRNEGVPDEEKKQIMA